MKCKNIDIPLLSSMVNEERGAWGGGYSTKSLLHTFMQLLLHTVHAYVAFLLTG